jgi:hypothetical protein
MKKLTLNPNNYGSIITLGSWDLRLGTLGLGNLGIKDFGSVVGWDSKKTSHYNAYFQLET